MTEPIDIGAKLRKRAEVEQEAAKHRTESAGEVFLPYGCAMCGMRTALLVQCSVCCDEGCGICIPGGDRSPCLTCDAQEEMATAPEMLPVVEPLTPEQEAELDALYEEWAGEEADDTPEPEDDDAE